jgi:hypothetical protein
MDLAYATRLLLAAALVVTCKKDDGKDAVLARCIPAVEQSAQEDDPYRAGKNISDACAPLYSEPACRKGWADAWAEGTDPTQRIRILTTACRDAYCPKLAEPKPALCDGTELTILTIAPRWNEFNRAIITRELGEARAQRYLAAVSAAADARMNRVRSSLPSSLPR